VPNAEELARFESMVVRGPGPQDCAIWTGTIGGDGYGRFWVRRDGGERIMVRANRYALAAAQDGVALEASVRALHGCDNTVCVRVSQPGETGLLHVVGGLAARQHGDDGPGPARWWPPGGAARDGRAGAAAGTSRRAAPGGTRWLGRGGGFRGAADTAGTDTVVSINAGARIGCGATGSARRWRGNGQRAGRCGRTGEHTRAAVGGLGVIPSSAAR
jgi:hypothetical protein